MNLFRKYLLESNLPKEFEVEIDSVIYVIKREHHVISSRGNTKFPRDSGMTKNKYKLIIQKIIKLYTK